MLQLDELGAMLYGHGVASVLIKVFRNQIRHINVPLSDVLDRLPEYRKGLPATFPSPNHRWHRRPVILSALLMHRSLRSPCSAASICAAMVRALSAVNFFEDALMGASLF